MWPFRSKKKPILREIDRELIGKETEYDHITCDVTSFHRWLVTYQDIENNKTFTREELSLA